jgi:hypothetical protein
MNAKKFLTWWMIQVFLLLCCLIATEYILRFRGFAPGNIQPEWNNFKLVDTLIEIPHFIPDKHGILTANRRFFSHINDWGFRFDKSKIYQKGKKKVMLIGDSFVWGMSAAPQDSCFADLLDRHPLLNVLNFGIPIADPLQYKTIVEMYADSVQPDEVVVVFYTGNDVMMHERDIRQQPFYYYTNAGALLATDGNRFFRSAKEAYQYYAFEKYRIVQPSGWVQHLALHSALISRFLSIVRQWKEKEKKDEATQTLSVSKKYLYPIFQYCAEKNVRFTIALIPEYKELQWFRQPFRKKYRALLLDEQLGKHCRIPELTADMYHPYPDAHFNNSGHKAFAMFLEKILLRP